MVYAVILSLSSTALGLNVFPRHDQHDPEGAREEWADGCYLIGYALVQWMLEPTPIENDSIEFAILRGKASKGSKARQGLVGYLNYRILEFVEHMRVEMPAYINPVPIPWVRESMVGSFDAAGVAVERPMSLVLESWQAKYGLSAVGHCISVSVDPKSRLQYRL